MISKTITHWHDELRPSITDFLTPSLAKSESRFQTAKLSLLTEGPGLVSIVPVVVSNINIMKEKIIE